MSYTQSVRPGRRRRWTAPFLLVLMALVATACSSGGSETTTTQATTPQTTAAPQATTTTLSAQDAAVAAAQSRSWRVGITGEGVFNRDGTVTGYQFNKLPLALAIMDMNSSGWDIAPIFLNQSEAPVQAEIQGSIDIANSSITPVITAVAAGAHVKVFAKARGIEYVMLTTSDINGPEDLNGKRVGIHAAASTTTLLVKLYLKDTPDVKPTILIVPGSSNRIQAMLAGELDATAAQFGDDTTAMNEAPGKFHVIFNFAKEMPQLIDSAFSYNSDRFDDNTRVFAEQLLAKTLEYNRKFYADPKYAADMAAKYGVVEQAGVDRYIEGDIFPTDIGMDVQSLQFTIQGLVDAGLIEGPGPDPSSMFDESIWNAVKDQFS